MTVNVAVVTNEYVVLGCDSVASITQSFLNPVRVEANRFHSRGPLRVAAVFTLGVAGWLTSLPVQALFELKGNVELSAGGAHNCTLTTAGGVKCWGYNAFGQLGNNSTTDSPTPVDAFGLASGVVAISAGAVHNCALSTAGGVMCWGYNYFGQLGTLTTDPNNPEGIPQPLDSHIPKDVPALTSGVATTSVGGNHTCVLTTVGGAQCFGANGNGELGNNFTTPYYTAYPADVTGLSSGVGAISPGGHHTCALTTAGGAKCWGYNAFGQLGDNSTTQRLTPVDVAGLESGVAAISAGDSHTCALTTAGGAKCWGNNNTGQLGNNSSTNSSTPVDVSGLESGVAAISAGGSHTCALTTAGGVKCWGHNITGQLGNNSTADSATPVDVTGLATGVVAISAGGSHTCALTTGSGVECWGSNDHGQLGDGTITSARPFPAPVLAPLSVPDAPLIGNALPGSNQATIFFAPSFDGGSAITSYTATCDAGGFTQSGPSSPITVPGLANGTAYTCSVTATNAVGTSVPSDSVSVTPVAASGPRAATSPTALDFGVQSMGTTSPAQMVTVINTGAGTLTISGISLSNTQFAQTNDCSSLAAGAVCTIIVTFTPAVTGGGLNSAVAVSETLTITTNSGSPNTVPLVGTAEKSLVSHYYQAILNRSPDASGEAFWNGEVARLASLGADLREAYYVMAGYFFNSAEYASYNKTDAQFIADLYNTFFNRPPDPSGVAYWSNQIASGLPREVVLFSFMFSTEFQTFTTGIFGNTAARPEVNMVMDFFRGVLNRLPDTTAYNFWVGQLKTAQCQGPGAVYTAVNSISYAFIFGPEYANRFRNNTQFVTDMYNSFLRRGGDTAGVLFWVNQLNTSAQDRNTERASFISTPEFGARVNAVIAAGCAP